MPPLSVPSATAADSQTRDALQQNSGCAASEMVQTSFHHTHSQQLMLGGHSADDKDRNKPSSEECLSKGKKADELTNDFIRVRTHSSDNPNVTVRAS